MNVWDFVNSINTSKKNIIENSEDEKQYNPWIVNRAMSQFNDTVLFANEMNQYMSTLDLKLQYDFYLNGVRKKKRYTKWAKKEEAETLEIIKQYYGYRTEIAIQIIDLLTPTQINEIREKMNKGGKVK